MAQFFNNQPKNKKTILKKKTILAKIKRTICTKRLISLINTVYFLTNN